MKASDKAFALIRKHEVLKLNAYRCPAGVLTIGYGHTGKDVKPGISITAERAEQLLTADVAFAADSVATLARTADVRLRQNQFDALVCFVYNLGIANLRSSTLWRCIAEKRGDKAVAEQWMRWVYAGGAKLKGLVNRRTDELQLYLDKA